jgi:purine-binding chemotaxis protein CheW
MTPRPPTPAGGIDWQKLRERLARACAATEGSVRLSPERARAVMEERARTLARVPPRPPHAAEVLEIVTFALAGERYAVETRHVREVVRPAALTPVPGAPDFLVGLHNLRGDILAVFDLRRFFGVADREATDLSRVIVLGGERAEFGALADAVHEVTTLRIDEVHEPPASVGGAGRGYLRGVTAGALVVLDGAALLRDGRLFIDQAEEAPPAA